MTPAPVVRGLVDTPVLIEYRDGEPNAVQFVTELRLLGLPDMSQLSALVLYARCQNPHETAAIAVFLSISTVHKVSALTMRRAFSILENLPAPCGLTADDAIVAATAIEHNLPLYTLDPARFAAVPGLTALRPY